MRRLNLLFYLVFLQHSLLSQSSLNMQPEGELIYPDFISALTPVADILGRPYVYVSSNELGVIIVDVQDQPVEVAAVDVATLGMRAMSLTQRDTLLFVCIGSHFDDATDDPPGLVILDVSDPQNPVLVDSWVAAGTGNGAGIVKVNGDYAFLGAMSKGLIILNISDPSNISFVSQIIPPIDFPTPLNDQSKVNARGMEVIDSLVYLCYDAGGLRVINCSDIYNPVETGQYANPITVTPWNMPRAYNNIVLDDTVAYIAVDYCGIEVIDIRNNQSIQLLHHWNPHGCPSGGWHDAPFHTNELFLKKDCDQLFISSGKTDLVVLDISVPVLPVAIDSFGTALDTLGSWGLTMTDENIYLTYTNVPLWIPSIFVPFYSDHGGLKKINYSNCLNGMIPINTPSCLLFPNPSNGCVYIKSFLQIETIDVKLPSGQLILSTNNDFFSTLDFPIGIYFVEIKHSFGVIVERLLVTE